METNKTLKIYGVPGMTEWHTTLRCKQNITLRVSFADGFINTGGITPAQYRTTNPAFQDLIESSAEFKTGKIKLLKTYKSTLKTAAKPVKTQAKQTPAPAQAETPVADVQTPAEAGTPAEEPAKDADGLTAAEVSDIESDGRQYLIKECGVPAKKLTSVAAVLAEAKANGIKFVVKE